MENDFDLAQVALFEKAPAEALAEIAAALESRALPPGTVLFHQGDAGDEMYIIHSGSIALFIPSEDRPGQERPIRIIGPGEILGEMALIDHQPRSVSARALEESRVLVLTGDCFRQILRRYPDVALAVMSGLSDRIRYTTDFLGEVREWVRRVAGGEYDRGFTPQTDYRDRSIAALAAEFAQMAAQVQRREEALRQQIADLRIEIDQAKKERQVDEIVESEYFQQLRAQARQLRQRQE